MFYLMTMAHEKVGVYPQVIEDMREHSQEAFIKANYELNPALNYTIPAPPLVIRAGAKVTDALSAMPIPFPFIVVNERVINFIQSVQADSLRLMPTSAVKKDISYPYWLMAIDVIHAEYVNYHESRFVLSNTREWIGEISITSAEEYRQIDQQYTYPIYIRAAKLVLNEEVIHHDIFRLPKFTTSSYFVSEKFREGIEREKITGLRFDPAESAV